MHDLALIFSVVIATLVEAVEALTIVLAAGLARGWKPARRGTLLGLLTVAVIILIFGPLLLQFPVETLRLIVGLLSLIFGLQWLRKAILRSSGFKATHDESLIFQKELENAKSAKSKTTSFVGDWYAFTISYKAVVIEGIEVAFLVVTFGALQNKILVASLAATFAVVVVVLAGYILHKPLTKVPENSMKFVVGVILTTFGIFWTTEGIGATWAFQDLTLFLIAGLVVAMSLVLIFILRRRFNSDSGFEARQSRSPKLPLALGFIYDFAVGDDWLTAAAIYVAVVLGLLGIQVEWGIALVVLAVTAARMLAITSRKKETRL
jgi:uncharacterized membrane protein